MCLFNKKVFKNGLRRNKNIGFEEPTNHDGDVNQGWLLRTHSHLRQHFYYTNKLTKNTGFHFIATTAWLALRWLRLPLSSLASTLI